MSSEKNKLEPNNSGRQIYWYDSLTFTVMVWDSSLGKISYAMPEVQTA